MFCICAPLNGRGTSSPSGVGGVPGVNQARARYDWSVVSVAFLIPIFHNNSSTRGGGVGGVGVVVGGCPRSKPGPGQTCSKVAREVH